MVLRENFRGIIIVSTIFAVCFLLVATPIVLRSSPVIQTTEVRGTLENVLTLPLDPKNSAGRGFQYRYGIRLHDEGAVVFADDDLDRPHIIGSEVILERQHRQNGISTYRLLGN